MIDVRLSSNDTSPITRNFLAKDHLVPNRALRDAIIDGYNKRKESNNNQNQVHDGQVHDPLRVGPVHDDVCDKSIVTSFQDKEDAWDVNLPTSLRRNRLGHEVHIGTGSDSNKYYCGRGMGMDQSDTSSVCGPCRGYQCLNCTGLKYDTPVNSKGYFVKLGYGVYNDRYYCQRSLDSDVLTIVCGPRSGPQCHDCSTYQYRLSNLLANARRSDSIDTSLDIITSSESDGLDIHVSRQNSTCFSYDDLFVNSFFMRRDRRKRLSMFILRRVHSKKNNESIDEFISRRVS